MTPEETGYILNSFMFLISGAFVMWMAAGFTMLEAGLVRTRNTATICLKNISLYALAGLFFYIIGYNLMYSGVPSGGWIGSFNFGISPSEAELALNAADSDKAAAFTAATEAVTKTHDYSTMSDWFFQMVFVATAASIVSGTVAERIKLYPFLIFTTILTALIYPIQGAWSWGGGWLDALGFSDFAGSTIVHSVGGWAALMGAILLGARHDKYDAQGNLKPIPGANLPLATLGTFILWMGWFGFNGGSVLALNNAQSASIMSLVYANTNLAAAAGAVIAMIATQIRYKKPDLTMVLNGALGGLVSITAGPDVSNPAIALLIGGIGGILVILAVPILDRLKIDDAVGAISVHLVCGIWGTLAVGIFGSGTLWVQLVGIVAIGAYVSLTSFIVWYGLKKTIGIRVDERDERHGLDIAELGMDAYPEFVKRM